MVLSLLGVRISELPRGQAELAATSGRRPGYMDCSMGRRYRVGGSTTKEAVDFTGCWRMEVKMWCYEW
jgi:hypothetical protein